MSAWEHIVRAACQERCAEAGDPPCYVLDEREGKDPDYCRDCRAEAGDDVDSEPAPLDPAAVVAPLL